MAANHNERGKILKILDSPFASKHTDGKSRKLKTF